MYRLRVTWPLLISFRRILVYPPGQKGAVNITNGDLMRLAPGEFLNDTLVEFGLK
jgi:Ulp1 family protease